MSIQKHLRIPSIKVNGDFYHGTVINKEDNPFESFTFNGDFDGVWFADNKEVAIKFAENWADESNNIVLYHVKIKSPKIANISYELSQKLITYYQVEDFRELIPILKERGFKGWIVPGSIDTTLYNDYCLFYNRIPVITKIEKQEIN